MGESLMLAGSTLLQNGGAAHRSASSRSVLAEPSEIEAPEGEDTIFLPNGFWGRYIGYTATSPGLGRCQLTAARAAAASVAVAAVSSQPVSR